MKIVLSKIFVSSSLHGTIYLLDNSPVQSWQHDSLITVPSLIRHNFELVTSFHAKTTITIYSYLNRGRQDARNKRTCT
jgi:hypothetical protein